MRQGYAFVSVYIRTVRIYGGICVSSKNTLVYVSPLEIHHKNKLCSQFIVLRRHFLCWQSLLERLIHGFLKLRVLVRAIYGIVGVPPNLLSISTHSVSRVPNFKAMVKLIDHKVSVSFCDAQIKCYSVGACMVAMLSSIIYLELSMD